MSIRTVLRMGDPLLLRVSQPVGHLGTPELTALLGDMRDTMASLNGAGLAAPQIGVSVPGMRGLVPRYLQLRYRGFDERGQALERRVSGFHARVVQHEVDHLDGVLYPMRITDMRYF